MKKISIAVWKGSGKEGSGHLTTESQSINKIKYSLSSRFANEKGTNPEELIAAAHAACFNMRLSFLLTELGFKPEMIETKAAVTIESGVISHSHLTVKASVPDIPQHKFEEFASVAKETCPVSRALFLTISLEALLVEKIMV